MDKTSPGMDADMEDMDLPNIMVGKNAIPTIWIGPDIMPTNISRGLLKIIQKDSGNFTKFIIRICGENAFLICENIYWI